MRVKEPMGLMVVLERELMLLVEVAEVVLEDKMPLRVVMEVIVLQIVDKVVEILGVKVLVVAMDIKF